MCSERFSVVGLMLRGLIGEAERVMPGKGCELIAALSSVGDMALVVGLATGFFLAVVLHDLVGSVLVSRRYRQWKEARNVD